MILLGKYNFSAVIYVIWNGNFGLTIRCCNSERSFGGNRWSTICSSGVNCLCWLVVHCGIHCRLENLLSVGESDRRLTWKFLSKGCLNAVLLKSRSKHFIFQRCPGRWVSFEHPITTSFSSDIKLSMLRGRHVRYWQSLRLNKVRAVKHSIDEGSFSIAVLSKWSSDRLLIIPLNSGIFPIFGQPQSLRILSDSISLDMLGRSVRETQYSRSKTISLLSCPIDGWISTKLLHQLRCNLSSLGTPLKSGVSIRSSEYLRSKHFKLSKYCSTQKKILPLNRELIF